MDIHVKSKSKEAKAQWEKALGKRLRAFRDEIGLSVRQVALQSGVDQHTIKRIERGTGGGIRLYEAIALRDIYNKTLSEISGIQIESEDKNIELSIQALKSFNEELRHHYRFVLRAIQSQLENEEQLKGGNSISLKKNH